MIAKNRCAYGRPFNFLKNRELLYTALMPAYTPTIGLEIHAELKTQTKMFCASKNDPDEKRPNVNVCPICMGHPGTLPTINKEAVRHVLRVGVAVGGTLADFSEFDRKNYFYPDIPKGYQISQYAYPLVKGGSINGVALTRIHLEEDTARNQHAGDHSLVDFNRAGVPLMELVTEPVIHSAKEAGDFGREFQLLLRTLGVSDADMEKGHLRMEVNISLSESANGREWDANDPNPYANLGSKVEIKNINSFSYAEKAIEYEIKRQTEILAAGAHVEQETRGWDSVKNQTYSQRKKESSHDYRYFPEPDLPKLKLSEIPEFSHDALMASLPELPWERRARYESLGTESKDSQFKINKEYIEMLLVNDQLSILFDQTAELQKGAYQLIASFICSDIVGFMNAGGGNFSNITPERLAKIIVMFQAGKISSTGAKTVLRKVYESGGDPQEIVEKEGLLQQSDRRPLEQIANQVVVANIPVFINYQSGKFQLLQFFVGQGMKISKGSANPEVLSEIFKERLGLTTPPLVHLEPSSSSAPSSVQVFISEKGFDLNLLKRFTPIEVGSKSEEVESSGS